MVCNLDREICQKLGVHVYIGERMNGACQGKVLLVGEGDFSLSVSLSHFLEPRQMTATCLLTPGQLTLHKEAPQNIHILREKGAEVLCEVDATLLHNDHRLQDNRYERIIFNFPHVGGKSNIKKNRQLLKDFFTSTVAILEQDGTICVTLAKGQGGTPADQPMREWQNSWQVVAMATYADLVLQEALPFVSEDYQQYSCTGFRSQDKHFLTRGGVTHVFRQSDPIPLAQPSLQPRLVSIDNKAFWTNPYIADKMERCRKMLMLDTDHPLSVTLGQLKAAMQQLGIIIAPDPSPLVQVNHNNINIRDCNQSYLLIHEVSIQGQGGGHMLSHQNPALADTPEDISSSFGHLHLESASWLKSSEEIDDISRQLYHRSPKGKDFFLLRSSLKEDLLKMYNAKSDKLEEQVYVCVGDCYERKTIDDDLPVHINMMGVGHIKDTQLGQQLSSLLTTILPADNKYHIEIHPKDRYHDILLMPNICTSGHSERIDKSTELCAQSIGSIVAEKSEQMDVTIFEIQLDKLVSILNEESDSRLLWSDSKSSRQLGRTLSTKGTLKPSIFPPSWQFDISFWESDIFNEFTFCDVFRDYAGDNIIKLDMIDSYVDSAKGQRSRCYRHVYQSCDRALSYDKAHDVQKYIRLILATILQIQLR